MKVRLYIENENWYDDDCCVVAEFPCAPRVGEYVAVDWDSVKDAVIRGDRVFDFREYLRGDSKEWYCRPDLQETMVKPSAEQVRKEMSFDGVGKILSVMWVVEDGEAWCKAWVGEM